jgi:hypothetical protein
MSTGTQDSTSLPLTEPNLPLFVHVGGANDARQAALAHDLGALIWRGRAGADLISELEADPVTGADALLDFATYEYQQSGKDVAISIPVRGSRMATSFAPGYFADHRQPQELDRWLDESLVAAESLRGSGILGQLVPTVALTQQWLVKEDLLDHLIEVISTFDGPVAIVLASSNNPLGAAEQIRGAVDLVRSTGNVIALRSDEAAIGLLAHGALLAAVGSSSTTRHLFYGRPSSKPKRRPGHEVFHPLTMSWIKHYRLDVFAVQTEDLLCECAVCDGRSILRFADPALVVEVVAHSVLCLQSIAAKVMTSADPVSAWIDQCAAAADASDRLNGVVDQFNLGRSAKAWRSALQPSS